MNENNDPEAKTNSVGDIHRCVESFIWPSRITTVPYVKTLLFPVRYALPPPTNDTMMMIFLIPQ